jgi:hypothetical protein
VDDINDLPWVELNDVRGFDPNSPRYHWMHTSNARTYWRTLDADTADAAASVSFFDQFEPRRPVVLESDMDSADITGLLGSHTCIYTVLLLSAMRSIVAVILQFQFVSLRLLPVDEITRFIIIIKINGWAWFALLIHNNLELGIPTFIGFSLSRCCIMQKRKRREQGTEANKRNESMRIFR